VDGSGQAGYVILPGNPVHAAVWSGNAASFVDLNPPGADHSEARGGGGQAQGGYAYFINGSVASVQAALWYGSPAYINLSSSATLYPTTGSWQGGALTVGPALHPVLFSGSADSIVDLTPSGASGTVYGLDDSHQVGGVSISGAQHAALWSGSAGSFVDLHPIGAVSSLAYGVSGLLQAGVARFGTGAVPHAALWSGTAASYVDLSPPGTTNSVINAASGMRQGGYVKINDRNHAALWSGTASSFVDLQLILGADYTNSVIQGVWTDGNVTYAGGYAYPVSSPTKVSHAILWKVLEPPLLEMSTASVVPTNLTTLTWSNNGTSCDLQTSVSITGTWTSVLSPKTTDPNWISTTVTNNSPVQFFRLRAN